MRELMYDFGRWLQRKSFPNPKIEFYSPVEGIEDWAPIIPASKAVPQWYRDLPKNHTPSSFQGDKILPSGSPPEWRTTGETIKTCPGVQDILTTGYIVPFWGSALIEVSQDGKSAASITSSQGMAYADGASSDFVRLTSNDSAGAEFMKYLQGQGYTEDEVIKWKNFQQSTEGTWEFGTHPEHQYSTLLSELPEEWSSTVLKLVSPWRIKTPPGFSTMVMPIAYSFNPMFEVLPGIIHTDYYRTFNLFMIMKNRGAKYHIPFKEHLCQWVCFPRHSLPYELRSSSEEDLRLERKAVNVLNTNWGSGRQYRLLGKLFNKKTGGKCPFS